MEGEWQKGVLQQHSDILGLLVKVVDATIIYLLLLVLQTGFEPSETGIEEDYRLVGLLSVVGFYFFSELVGLYQSWRVSSLTAELGGVFLAWLPIVVAMTLLVYAQQITLNYSRPALAAWFLFTPALLGGWRLVVRLLLRELRRHGFNTRAVAIVGAGETGIRVLRTLERSPWTGLRPVGFFEDRISGDGRLVWGGAVAGNFNDLVRKAKEGKIDVIYIALPLGAQKRIEDLTGRLADTTAAVYLIPDFFICNLFHGKWYSLGRLQMVSVFDTPFQGGNLVLKRLEDLVLASIILMVVAVPMLLIALAVKLSSPGDIIFRQRRYGIDGKEIMVWKFRSMYVTENGDRVIQATQNDGRVTPLGRFLRRTSLDELPQFINVLTGEMSIVGPRPHAVAHNEEYRSRIKGYMLRHAVKPGITGWAQINGWRGETESLHKMEQRIEHDLWYIRNWSFGLDIKIIFLTIIRGFNDKRAF